MSQPILSIEHDALSARAKAHLLPCRIHHDGAVDNKDSFWNPTNAKDESSIAYFRGRKLQGRAVALPQRYEGVVVERKPEPQRQPQTATQALDDGGDEEMQGPETAAMRVTAKFDEIVVWGHEALANAHEDPFTRSLEEWLQVVEKIHAYPENDNKTQK